MRGFGTMRSIGIKTAVFLCASAMIAAIALASPAPAAQACAVQPPALPSNDQPPLRFGVTMAGQLMDDQQVAPGSTARDLRALHELAGGQELTARIYRIAFPDGRSAIKRAVKEVKTYAKAGFNASLQLRYGMNGESGDPKAFARWVAQTVRAVGHFKNLISLEVTYEANLTNSQQTSDGHFDGVIQGLIGGVLAAHKEIQRDGFDQLKVGFVWFYNSGPNNEERLWSQLGSEGGSKFAAALDWVGLNIFPGTSEYPGFLPVTPAGAEDQTVIQALAVMRQCYLPLAGLDDHVALHIQENSYPINSNRPESLQAAALDRTIRAVDNYRGTYNVTDYFYWTLRDAQSGSSFWADTAGLLRDDYSPRPLFDTYKSLIKELGTTN